MTLDDPAVVRAEYQDGSRLAARKAAHERAEGPDAREVVFRAVAEAAPRRILEVGCGEGELAERIARKLEAEIIAVDQSERMVELTRARGVDARVGNVERLEFDDASFECVVAAWMLYHVRDLERGLAEIARVLVPGGRLVAVTNARDHQHELYELIGRRPMRSNFQAEDAEEILPRHFANVERRNAHGWIVFPDSAAAQAYVDSHGWLEGSTVRSVEGPIRVRRSPAIFVAEKP